MTTGESSSEQWGPSGEHWWPSGEHWWEVIEHVLAEHEARDGAFGSPDPWAHAALPTVRLTDEQRDLLDAQDVVGGASESDPPSPSAG